jgi:octaprenyl-diphosphate synthase
MAFQIVDDVLDLTASEAVLGKPVASDLREGKATLAIIHALDHCTPEERKQIETVLTVRSFESVTHSDILAILNRYGSLQAANAEAVRYAEAAKTDLAPFPENDYKRALMLIPQFVVEREK